MEESSSCVSEHGDERRVLEGLLEAFGSVFTLREIASAFCKAGQNADLTAEILYDSQGSTSKIATNHASNGELRGAKPSEKSSENFPERSTCAERISKAYKPKKHSVSMGTVSGVIGKGYVRPTTSLNESCKATKPLKFDSKILPMAELWGEDVSLDSAVGNDPMHKDVEDFLFKMLGNGFQLGMDVIQEVLGCCGYDVKKSMEKLIDLSVSTLKKSDDIIGGSTEKFTDKYAKLESPICQESEYTDFARRNGTRSPNQDKERYDLQREVLESLFSVPGRLEEAPRRTRPVRAVKKTGAFGPVVTEPLTDTIEHSIDIVEPPQDIEDEEEDSYQVLRRAAKEHWITMKEYYKSAADAFAKGDRTLADELLERGQFFNNKAREADEKSAQKIYEIRNKEAQDEMTLDLHDHDPKEAIRLLKFHLTSLSGIPAIRYLKVIMETDAEDITKGSRKRLVLKLLEKESIKWTEEGNAGIIRILVDEINPRKLSFAKNRSKQ